MRGHRILLALLLTAAPAGAQIAGAEFLSLVREAIPRVAARDDAVFEDLASLWYEFQERWPYGNVPTSAEDLDEWTGYLWCSLLLADAAPEQVGLDARELLSETAAFVGRYDNLDRPAQAIYLLAEDLVGQNDLDTAEFMMRWALETLPEAITVAPILWRLYADTARVRGSWDQAYERLDGTEASLERLETSIDRMPASARPAYEGYLLSQRARLAGARGQLWLELGVLDESILLIEEGEAFAEASGLPTTREALLGILLDWKLQSGDYLGVLRELDEVDAGSLGGTVGPSNRAVFEVIRAQARMLLELEDPKLARESAALFRSALERPELDSSLRESVHLSLAELALVAGDLEEAAENLHAAAEIERLGSAVPTHRRAVRAALESELALSNGSAPQQLRAAYASLREAHSVLLDEWEAAPKKKRGAIGFLHTSPRRRVLGELFRMAIAVHGKGEGTREGLEALFATQAMGMLSRDLAGDLRPTVETVRRELLGADHGCLIYLPAEFRSHLFVLGPDTLEHLELPGLDEIRVLYRPLERLLSAPRIREAEALHAARELSRVLLPTKARARLASWSALTVIGGELLGTVPFDALVLDDALLGERVALASLPSASLGLALRRRFDALGARRIADAQLDLVLMGTLDPGEEVWRSLSRSALVRRRFTEQDARGLLAPFEIPRRRGIYAEECRRSTLKRRSEQLSRAAIVHFVTHGLYLRARDRGACLALSPERDGASGLTTCDDVERDLDLSGLVILSACGTARGPRRLGDDDLSHLGGAFLRAGASAVILSRAQVGYEVTLSLMEGVHERLARGDSPAEALRRARAELSDSDPMGSFQRAQFEVLGLGHQVVTRD